MQGHNSPYTYKDAGVNIDAGDALVERIMPFARATARKGADAALGGFGALFDLKAAGFKDPILVASTDGAGTKVKLAIEAGILNTVGVDLVAMCVNDIVVQGAEPLFFLDYYASAKLDVEMAAEVIEGVAKGCREAGCALVGGETAEMPGLYTGGDFDLAGFAVGAAERGAVLPRLGEMREGDVLIGVASSGIHSNGFSLVRRLIADKGLNLKAPAAFEPSRLLGDALLTPTRIYVKAGLAAIRAGGVHALAHITGGGITENLPRVLAPKLHAEINLDSWPLPPVFAWLKTLGGIEENEMLRTFNCGIGLIAAVRQGAENDAIAAFEEQDEHAFVIGKLVRGNGETAVVYRGALKS